MAQAPLRSLGLLMGVEPFEKIIRFWRSRSDHNEALTPQEIAESSQ